MKTYIDIETVPDQADHAMARAWETVKPPANMSRAETIAAWQEEKKPALVKEAYHKTGLDGGYGEVISIAYAIRDEPIKTFTRRLDQPESDILVEAFNSIREDNGKQEPYFVGHNVPFDLKFLRHRSIVRGIDPVFDLPFDGRHGSGYYDTMQAWAGFRQFISQGALCEILGIKSKDTALDDGLKVWEFAQAGRTDDIAEYNAEDVRKVREIWKRMHYFNQQTKED